MNKDNLMDECSSLMSLDVTEDPMQHSPQHPENLLRVVSNLEPEPGHHFPCDKERRRCKIKVRIHHLDADQTHQLQQLLEQFAADASDEFDVSLSLKQRKPASSFASSLSQSSEDGQNPASSSADVLDYLMQACEPSLAGSLDRQPLSPTRSSDLLDDILDGLYQSDDDEHDGNGPLQLPSVRLAVGSSCAGLAYRFSNPRPFDDRSVVSAPVV